jgi:hypothetical protein
MIEEKVSSTRGATAQNALLSDRKKAMRGPRKVRILLRQVAVWLDNWGLRGYPQDTHDWASKVERLRGLKSTARHIR